MKESRFTFFRQSGWLVMATILSSVFMIYVHSAAQRMPKDPATGLNEYGIFYALLNTLAQIAIPALGLQTLFAQQAVAGTDAGKRPAVRGVVWSVMQTLLIFWVIVFLFAFFLRERLLAAFSITNPMSLWITLAVALVSMLMPIFGGLLQGKQDFAWFGGGTIINAVGRCAGVMLFVVILGTQAAGAMAGVLFGAVLALILFAWRTRELWFGPRERCPYSGWLRRVIPLTLGLGVFTYMFTEDMLIVQRMFPEDSGKYGAARVVGAALVFLTAPLAQVLFPKIVRSAALSEKTNVLTLALGATMIVGALAALACMALPKLPLIVLRSPYVEASAPLVPWFAWCMLPLAAGNVLINNLLARERYSVVPWLVLVAIGYALTLRFAVNTYTGVMLALGAFSTLLVAVCVVFTLRTPRAGVTQR